MKIPSSTWAAVGVLAATWAVPAVAEPPDARRRADMRQKHDASVREHAQELMQQLARDKDPEVRAHAATVLGKIKVVDAIPVLTTAVADGDPGVRAAAAGALWRLAPESRGAVPALEKALGDATPLVRLNAAGALNALDAGTPSKMAAVLGPLLSDADLAKSAAEVLVSTDLENADVRRYVLEGLTRGEGDVRKAIVLGMADARLSRSDPSRQGGRGAGGRRPRGPGDPAASQGAGRGARRGSEGREHGGPRGGDAGALPSEWRCAAARPRGSPPEATLISLTRAAPAAASR